jgi:hypothetical protein
LANLVSVGRRREEPPSVNGAAFKNEDQILDTIRRQLRELRRSRDTGEVVFRLSVREGGPTGLKVRLVSEFEFLEKLE